MNEHFKAFVDQAKSIAEQRGLNWNVRLGPDGLAVKADRWNLTKIAGGSPPPVHWISDFGTHNQAVEILKSEGHSNCHKLPMSQGWLDFYKATIVDQLLVRRNSTIHILSNVASPIRLLATASSGHEPWQINVDDIVRAYELGKRCQPSGKIADSVIGVIKETFDSNHIADIGPLYPALSVTRKAVRKNRASYTKSIDHLRSELEERKSDEKLPERRAFWELVRIVFTEKPQSFLDLLRFAQVKVMLLCGLRVGEASLLPKDWMQVHEYFDTTGLPAGKLGGYSRALSLRHFAEKQQSPNSDSVALVEALQYIPQQFESILTETLDDVVRATEPLRKTLRQQIESGRILPQYQRDECVSVFELYPILSGNPVMMELSDDEFVDWQERYRKRFDPSVIDELVQMQRTVLQTEQRKLTMAFYLYFNRMKGKVTFRNSIGQECDTSRVVWSRVYMRIDELECYLHKLGSKLSDKTPLRLASGDVVQPWELLFLMPKRALAEGRNDGLCDINQYYSIGRFDNQMMSHALGMHSGKDGSHLFEHYGLTDEDRHLKLNSHSLRHLQNTELFRLGVADTIISKRFNRRSVTQSYEYDHRSLAEDLAHIELPPEVEIALGDKAATVARLIKAGKASGPIVNSFKKIQREQGDDAAFEFLSAEADGFHSTPYGHCINSFTVDPCPKHLECFSGCRHLTATNLPAQRANLIQLEQRLQVAIGKIEARTSSSIGRQNQLEHAKNRLDAVRQVLETPAGSHVFPDGNDYSKSEMRRTPLDAN